MELFNSPAFESSPRRQPPAAVRSEPVAASGFQLLASGMGGENPLKKMLDSKWLIPICTIVVVVIFLVGAWLYSNYFVTTPLSVSRNSSPSKKESLSGSGPPDPDTKSKRVKSLSPSRKRRSTVTESAKRRTYAISEYDKTTPYSVTA